MAAAHTKPTPPIVVGSLSSRFSRGRGREYIVAAAVRCPDTGTIYIGEDHSEARSLTPPGVNPVEWERGYYFNTNRFLPTTEGLEAARRSRQVSQREIARRSKFYRVDELLSEMILHRTSVI